jgi:nitroreductase
MDTYLAVASKRDERNFADREVPQDVVERILDAGRLPGSAVNRQPWRFVVVESPELKAQLAEVVYTASNVRGAALVVAIVATGGAKPGFDHGRAAQSMMLTAWNDGVASCPNGFPDADRAAEALGLGEDEQPAIVLSFGYPASGRDPQARSASEWSARANRKPLDELVSRA